jgi:hypothetical protein
MLKKTLFAFGFVAAVASQSQAKEVLSWEPDPISDPSPGFVWTGNNLIAGAGMASNGDGNNEAPGGNGVFSQPGLRSSVVFLLNNVSSSHQAVQSTAFFDTSMVLTGLAAAGDASNFGGLLVQNLSSGTFTITSSSDTTGGPVVLLSGTITNATLTGINNSNTGSVISATVTYTDGIVFDAMVLDGLSASGSLSCSLVDIIPSLSIDPETHHISAFSSNSSGLFAAEVASGGPTIPAPAALPAGLVLLLGLGLGRRIARVA